MSRSASDPRPRGSVRDRWWSGSDLRYRRQRHLCPPKSRPGRRRWPVTASLRRRSCSRRGRWVRLTRSLRRISRGEYPCQQCLGCSAGSRCRSCSPVPAPPRRSDLGKSCRLWPDLPDAWSFPSLPARRLSECRAQTGSSSIPWVRESLARSGEGPPMSLERSSAREQKPVAVARMLFAVPC